MAQDIWTRIDNTDWEALEHWKFSPQRDLVLKPPKLFRDLVSPDHQKREMAVDDIANLFSHQGSLKEGACHAIPFLLELEQDSKIQHKTEILSLLLSYTIITYPFENQDSSRLDTKSYALINKVYQQIEALTDYFLQRLSFYPGADRIIIIHMLGHLTTQAETVFFNLTELFHKTTNMDELNEIFEALSRLLRKSPSLAHIFENAYNDLFWEIINNEKYVWQLKIRSVLNYVFSYTTHILPKIEDILIDLVITNEEASDLRDVLFSFYYVKDLGKERYTTIVFRIAEQTNNNQFLLKDMLGSIFYSKFHHLPKEEIFVKVPLDKYQRRFFQLVVDNPLRFPLDDWSKQYFMPKTLEEIKELLKEDDKIKANNSA